MSRETSGIYLSAMAIGDISYTVDE